MKNGDYIRAESVHEFTVIEPITKRTRLEVELLEKIEEFRGKGHSDEYIVEQFTKVLEGMK